MNNFKNIIFDLGNVLLDIEYNKTTVAFEALGFKDFKSTYSPEKMISLFKDIETGRISEDNFYSNLKAISPVPVSTEQLKNAWNALLMDFRISSLEYLKQLAPVYNIYLLSNTNSIHLTAFDEILAAEGQPPLNTYFIKAYYSNIIEHRKPDAGSYRYVLEDAHIAATETLFIDDLPINIEGAKAVGLQTHLLLLSERIEDLGLV
ncbi:MAG: HAD family phosphatase [Ferruginibacter sp.]